MLSHNGFSSHESFEERRLLIDSRRFASETRSRSWFELVVTLAAFAAVAWVGLSNTHILVRVGASLVLGLLFVRIFALYHDYMHSTIFKDSWLAGTILKAFALILLTPPSVWKRTHDHHHNHNSKLFGSNIGSFPIMTVNDYREAKLVEKLEYRIARSPFSILGGYFVVFLWGMCIAPFINQPRKHLDCITALVLHVSTGLFVAYNFGWGDFAFLYAFPILFATAFGSYLFYVQHNFPGATVESAHSWTYTKAALHSSGHLKTGPLLRWFTANIGLHHVHHVNAKIPFYRLAEAYDALPPMQTAIQTTLSVSDIWSALRLKLWNEELDRFVTFAEARRFRSERVPHKPELDQSLDASKVA